MNDCRARWICPYVHGVFADIMHWINLVVCLLDYEWCTGEMNLPLRLRCVRCYTFTHWINFAVCLLDYEWLSGEMNLPLRLRNVRWYYAMNKPCGVFVGLWNDVRARWICPYAYGVFADITQWINLVVCLLNIIYPLFCCVFVGLWMMYGRDESVPTPTGCSLLYIYAMNIPCGMSVDIHFK